MREISSFELSGFTMNQPYKQLLLLYEVRMQFIAQICETENNKVSVHGITYEIFNWSNLLRSLETNL